MSKPQNLLPQIALLAFCLTGCAPDGSLAIEGGDRSASAKFTGGGFPGGGGPGGGPGGGSPGGGFDGDGDGFSSADGDCDDGDDTIHPSAAEVCDDVDNDCDGLLDALDPDISDAQTWFIDYDGDGIGVDDPRYTRLECGAPADGWSLDQGDCDDSGCSDECQQVINLSSGAETALFNAVEDAYLQKSSSRAGDHNGDGIDDILIGSPSFGEGGGMYVVNGALPLGESTIEDSADYFLAGEASGEYAGVAVGWAGDVNNDGFDDALIGAQYNDRVGTYAGAVYLMQGPISASGSLGDADTVLVAARSGDHLGRQVTGIGDANDDGYDDFLVSALLPSAEGDYAGESYLIHGPVAAGEQAVDDAADAILQGIEGWDWAGESISGAGDHDGDGYDDVLVGSFGAGADNEGYAYLVDGTTTGNLSLADADFSMRGAEYSDYIGENLSGGVDVNDDGFDDILIGSRTTDGVYLVLGPVTEDLLLSEDALTISPGVDTTDGISGHFVGDINDDGFPDVAVGEDDEGDRAYLFYGPISESLTAGDADVMFITDSTDRNFHHRVGPAGDANGDGVDDLLLIDYFDSSYDHWSGAVYLMAGASGGL